MRAREVFRDLIVQARRVPIVHQIVTNDVVDTLIDHLVLQAMLTVHHLNLTLLVWLREVERVKPGDVLFFEFERNLITPAARRYAHFLQLVL